MNPVSEYDILKYKLIVYRRLTPISELEGVLYGVNYDYKSFISRHYPAIAARLEQLTMDIERETARKLARNIMRCNRRI